MQGSYKKDGLPRPYYMKPAKRHSAYDKIPHTFFNSNRRKVFGYVILLVLFGTCMYFVSQDMKPRPDPTYELVNSNTANLGDDSTMGRANKLRTGKNPSTNGNIEPLVGSVGADKEKEKAGLDKNLAQGSKGDVGQGIYEAPLGGVANEAPVVGNDADVIIGNGHKNTDANGKVKSRNGRKVQGTEEIISEKEEFVIPPKEEKGSVVDQIVNQGDDDDFHVISNPL